MARTHRISIRIRSREPTQGTEEPALLAQRMKDRLQSAYGRPRSTESHPIAVEGYEANTADSSTLADPIHPGVDDGPMSAFTVPQARVSSEDEIRGVDVCDIDTLKENRVAP